MWASTYLYIYGLLFSVLSLIFWARAHSHVYPFRSIMRLIYSLSAGWLLVLGMISIYYTDYGPSLAFPVRGGLFGWLLALLDPIGLWVLPILVFLGFQMHLYGMFSNNE